MNPEGCLPFNLLFSLGTSMMVDVVVVDVFCALPAYDGPAGAGKSERPLVRTSDRRTERPGPHQGLDSKSWPSEGPVLWGAGARRVPDDSWGLAAGGLQYTREVFVQDGLGVLIRGAREEGQGVGGELGSTPHNLYIFSFLFLVKTPWNIKSTEKKQKLRIHFSTKNQCHTNLLNLLQPLLQRVHGVLLSLQALQAGDELRCKLCWFHRDHLLGRPASTLWGERNTLAVV